VIDVALQPAVTALEEVVVNVGYQEQTVETTTGSFSQISGADLEVDPATNLTNALKGEITGVFGVNTGGRPGQEGSNLRIRGSSTLNNNSPLVVIDGIPGRQGGLENLNPNNIENVSVLKGASAAIYGSRAANGVILVQTKQGRAGDTQINVGVEQSYNRPTVVPEMADAPTWMTMINELRGYRGNEPQFSQEEIEKHRNCPPNSWTCFNTDWYDAALKDFSAQTKANASVTGGSEDLQYRVSLRGLTKSGIATNSATRYNQVGFRSNLDGDLNESLSLALNLHGRWENRDYPTSPISAHWGAIRTLNPTIPARWPNGKVGPDVEDGNNPLIDASGETGFDNRSTYFFQSNLSLEADIPAIDGWRAEGTVAYDQRSFNRKEWETPWTLYFWDGESRDESGTPILNPAEKGVPEPRLSQASETENDVLLRGTTSYETTVGNHSGNLLIGTEFQREEGSRFSAFRRFFSTDELPELFAGGTEQRNNTGTSWHSSRLNFFGRANYNYREKYLLEFVARYDGSYIFPEGDRFGFFPSVSVGWRLGQEDWFNNFTNGFFDRLKLRSSYGQTGNDRIEPYQFLRTFGFNGKFAFGNGATATRVAPTRVPNKDVSWEVATQFDVGVEGAIFADRLTFDASYYFNSRDDILWFRSEAVPQTAGFSLPRENIGKVNSWGLEGKVGYTQDITSALSFRVGANVSWTANEIEYFAEPEGILPWQRATGNPMNTDLYYIADGILNTQKEVENNPTWPGARPGDIKFKDVNGDGQINADDRKRIDENGRPDIIGSFDLGFTYDARAGQVSVTANLQGAAQARQYVFATSGENGNYFQKFAERRWTPQNKDASGPRAYNRRDPYWTKNQNTYLLRDAKYLRLKTARVGYTLPANWSGAFGVNRAELYLNGRNLFTLTPIDILDPEAASSSASSYPQNQTFTVGIQMGF
jgi:TonB-linked SusC/RagA family outer membrane protein